MVDPQNPDLAVVQVWPSFTGQGRDRAKVGRVFRHVDNEVVLAAVFRGQFDDSL